MNQLGPMMMHSCDPHAGEVEISLAQRLSSQPS